MSWSHIDPHELLSGELVIDSRMAGAFIKLSDYGLRSLSYLNWGGTEKIGGKLHLTNYRLVFASNSWNRVVGKMSIFLPTIQGIKNTSFLLDRRIEISTQSQVLEFQLWGIPKLTLLIVGSQALLDEGKKEELRAKILDEYPTLGEELQQSKAGVMKFAEQAIPILQELAHESNPLRNILNTEKPPTVSTVLNILEMLEGKKS